MTTTLRYGLIGCGMMGQEHIRNIQLLPNAEVTACFEPDTEMRQVARQLEPNLAFFDSLDALLRQAFVDAWVVTSPNFRHAEQLQQLAALSPLPVLIEKPLCTSLEQLRSLRSLAATYPAPVWVAMEYRYMPPLAALLEELRSGTTIGDLKTLTIREHRFPFLSKVGDWNRFNANTGGTLVEKCCHFFDLMRLIIQSEPVRVYATGGQDVNHLDERYDSATPDILDQAFVLVDFANGNRACLELCMFAEGSRYQEEITVVGAQGKAECLIPGPTRFWDHELGEPPIPQLILSPRAPKGPRLREIPVDPQLLAAGDHNGSTFYQHQRFAQTVRGAAPVEVTLDDGAKSVLMGLAAQESIRIGQAVSLQAGDFALP